MFLLADCELILQLELRKSLSIQVVIFRRKRVGALKRKVDCQLGSSFLQILAWIEFRRKVDGWPTVGAATGAGRRRRWAA